MRLYGRVTLQSQIDATGTAEINWPEQRAEQEYHIYRVGLENITGNNTTARIGVERSTTFYPSKAFAAFNANVLQTYDTEEIVVTLQEAFSVQFANGTDRDSVKVYLEFYSEYYGDENIEEVLPGY